MDGSFWRYSPILVIARAIEIPLRKQSDSQFAGSSVADRKAPVESGDCGPSINSGIEIPVSLQRSQ